MSLSDILIDAGQAANGNPFFAKEKGVFKNLADQQQNASALAQLAQQTPGGPQGAPDGPPTPQQAQTIQQAQQANDPGQQQQQFYSALQQLGAINPNKYGQAAAQTSPLAQMGNLAALQLQKADAAAKQTEGIKSISHPDGTSTLYTSDGQGGISTQTVGKSLPLSDEGKKIHDLLNLNGQMRDNLATQPAGTAPAAGTPQGAQTPAQPSMGANIQNQIKYAMMTPDLQKAQDALSEQKAKDTQAAKEAAQSSQINGSKFNAQIDALQGAAPLVPWGGGSETAQEVEEKLANFNSSDPKYAAQAKAAQAWNQGMGQNFLGSIQGVMSGSGNIRGDLPIMKGIAAASEIPKTWSPQVKNEGLNSLRITNNNNTVIAQAKYQSFANGQSVQPKVIPYNAALMLAQQAKIPAAKIFDQLRDKGYMVEPSGVQLPQ